MLANRDALDGSRIVIDWDNQCSPVDTKILYGPLDQVSTYTVGGAECSISDPAVWDPVPAGDLWFVLVSGDGSVESSWGQATGGERNGMASSGTCGATLKDISGTCP